MIGLGIGINYSRVIGSIDTQAQAHYDRVIADGGIMPAGLLGCNAWFVAVKAVYAVTDITTAISAGYDPHYLGAKIGAGSGTTLGQAATKLYSCSGASGDLTQATAASMPLLLVKNSSDANYWFGSGVSGNYCSTPNAAANQITGDIEIESEVSFGSFSTTDAIAIKSDGVAGGSAFGYYFFKTNASLSFAYSNVGTVVTRTTHTSTSDLTSVGFSAGQKLWVKVTRQASSGDIKFYYSSNGTTYTQLGTTVSSTASTIANVNTPLVIGNWADILHLFFGKITRVKIKNSIGGTPVVDFNPASYNAATSQTQWVSATSEVWTINKSSGNTFVGVLVDRTIIQGNNTTTSMSVTIAGTQPYTEYLTATKNGVGTYVSRATGNARGHSGTNLTLANGTTLNFASTATTRQTMTYRNNGASSGIAVNNGTETTGNAGTNNGTTLVLAEGAHNITTFISSLAEDTAPQRAAMYTAVKSFNNY